MRAAKLILEQPDVHFSFPQEVRGFGQVYEGPDLGKSRRRAEADEEVRFPGRAGPAINAGIRRLKGISHECETFHPVLEKESKVRENAAQLSPKFIGLKLVFVKRVGTALSAGFGIVAFVGSRNDEDAIRSEDPCALFQKAAKVREVLNDLEGNNKVERCCGERKVEAGAGDVMRVRGGIMETRVFDGIA